MPGAGSRVSSIAQEKVRNPRLGQNRSGEEFVAVMDGLQLAYPRKIDFAARGNERCGACPDHVAERYRRVCQRNGQGSAAKRAVRGVTSDVQRFRSMRQKNIILFRAGAPYTKFCKSIILLPIVK